MKEFRSQFVYTLEAPQTDGHGSVLLSEDQIKAAYRELEEWRVKWGLKSASPEKKDAEDESIGPAWMYKVPEKQPPAPGFLGPHPTHEEEVEEVRRKLHSPAFEALRDLRERWPHIVLNRHPNACVQAHHTHELAVVAAQCLSQERISHMQCDRAEEIANIQAKSAERIATIQSRK